ncbi:pancreatic lipase-related protein 2-like [Anneissia japonica]|uniref:pancreatic lipase-related protein 2-like n=1 Tax=Anneissia japonica TaxID=1529436 RepID=UPI0014258A23|nr:pancreatic lipase-related protein 2-like [Anneissia japonica]
MSKLFFCFLVLVCSLPNTEGRAKKCYGPLGCFYKYTDNLLFDELPSTRNAVGTTFTLKTRAMTKPKSISASDVSSSNFNSAIPTKFIIHGFDESGSEYWVREMRRLLLIEGNYNVIVVDWEKGAEDDSFEADYNDAVGNSRIVGAEVDLLITKLQSVYTNISLDSMHLIGFSLGAHVAGFAGDRLNGGIGRITGLDPAKFGFQNERTNRRLDPSDAKAVDVIHTDTFSAGIDHSVGDVDYYPSGGDDQPGCEWYKMKIGCDHEKAVEYFLASIRDQQPFNCKYYRRKYRKKCTEK